MSFLSDVVSFVNVFEKNEYLGKMLSRNVLKNDPEDIQSYHSLHKMILRREGFWCGCLTATFFALCGFVFFHGAYERFPLIEIGLCLFFCFAFIAIASKYHRIHTLLGKRIARYYKKDE